MIGGKQHRLFKYDEDNSVLPDLHYRNTQEMLEEFKFIADEKILNDIVIENTYEFNDQIENDIKPINNKLVMPHIANTPEKLRELVEAKARLLYGDEMKPLIRDRIDKELNSIIDNGYAIVY
jgi:DNA polymerase-3 subunit alpha (Gram-positive type)